METITKKTDEFAKFFESQLNQLLAHDFIAQKQSQFFKNRKENLKDNEMLIICDFSENYTFVIQDEIQAYHWVNKQCTIHPFALYWKEIGQDKRKSIVVIAESLKHDVTAVYLFQKKLIANIKQNHTVKKLIFCSDGAGGQYKNRKNFYNISQFKNQFGIETGWHCFATAHGKSACDGIGGTFKRNARRASLQWNTFFVQKKNTRMHRWSWLDAMNELGQLKERKDIIHTNQFPTEEWKLENILKVSTLIL